MTVVPVAEKSQQPAATCFRRVEFQLQNYTAKTLLHDSKPAVKNFKTWWKFLENNLYVELISMHTMHLMPPCDLIKTIHFACKNNSKNSLRVGSYKATLLLATLCPLCIRSDSNLTVETGIRPSKSEVTKPCQAHQPMKYVVHWLLGDTHFRFRTRVSVFAIRKHHHSALSPGMFL